MDTVRKNTPEAMARVGSRKETDRQESLDWFDRT